MTDDLSVLVKNRSIRGAKPSPAGIIHNRLDPLGGIDAVKLIFSGHIVAGLIEGVIKIVYKVHIPVGSLIAQNDDIQIFDIIHILKV